MPIKVYKLALQKPILNEFSHFLLPQNKKWEV